MVSARAKVYFLILQEPGVVLKVLYSESTTTCTVIFKMILGIVIISDGVFGLPNAAMVHTLLAQLRSHTVCCSFVKVGSPFQAQCRYVM